MRFFRKKERKKVVIRSIEGRARDLSGIRKPSREEFEATKQKFLEACQKN